MKSSQATYFYERSCKCCKNARLTSFRRHIKSISIKTSIKLASKQVVMHHNTTTTTTTERYKQHQQIANSNKLWQKQYQQTNTTYQTSKQGKHEQALNHKSHSFNAHIFSSNPLCALVCVLLVCIQLVYAHQVSVLSLIYMYSVFIICACLYNHSGCPSILNP